MRPRVARVVLRKGHKERAMCHLRNSQEEQVRTEVRAHQRCAGSRSGVAVVFQHY